MLQSFPPDYKFCNPSEKVVIKNSAKHIGNAVPVELWKGNRAFDCQAFRRKGNSMGGNKFKLTLDYNVINHLGINLYSNIPAVISEAVANAWDADATEGKD